MTDAADRHFAHQLHELSERLTVVEHHVLPKVTERHPDDIARDVLLIKMWDHLRGQGARIDVSAQQLELLDHLRRYNGSTR